MSRAEGPAMAKMVSSMIMSSELLKDSEEYNFFQVKVMLTWGLMNLVHFVELASFSINFHGKK